MSNILDGFFSFSNEYEIHLENFKAIFADSQNVHLMKRLHDICSCLLLYVIEWKHS